MMPAMRFLPFLLLALVPFSALAADRPSFALPLACTYGEDCWVINYPDVGPENDGIGIDTQCLGRTYEGHKGVDFAIPDHASMKRGVEVFAAADGVVLRARGDEEDKLRTNEELEDIKKSQKECGNGVLIDHGDGWQTMYCHMKRGSLTVNAGGKVKKGQKIGLVGLTGLTHLPHLHFGVTHNDVVMDPFTGKAATQSCDAEPAAPLWQNPQILPYDPLRIVGLGFTLRTPELSDLDKNATPRTALRKDAPALIFHGIILGARKDDRITLAITDPIEDIFAREVITQEKTRARQMYFIGRKVPVEKPLLPGIYTGTVIVERNDKDGKPQVFSQNRKLLVQ